MKIQYEKLVNNYKRVAFLLYLLGHRGSTVKYKHCIIYESVKINNGSVGKRL